MANYINKQVIVRAASAGVFFGILAEKNGSEVTLKNVRRIWYWDGAASLSELAVNGVTNPKGCKFCVPVEELEVLGVIEVIPCTDKAVESINNVSVWKMSK